MKKEVATHKISACYYPGNGRLELTWEDIETRDTVYFATEVDKKTGEKIAKVVPCYVYHPAKKITASNPVEQIRTKVLDYLDRHIHARENDAALLNYRYDTRLAIIAEGRTIRDELRKLLGRE